MRTGELYVGLEVAVVSARLGLGDHFGPAKGKVLKTDVYEPNVMNVGRARTKTLVEVYRRDGTIHGEFFLDGKNITDRWADIAAEITPKIETWNFEQKKRQIAADLKQEQRDRQKVRCEKIYVLLAALGITDEVREVRYGPAVNLVVNDKLEILERILLEALQRIYKESNETRP